MDYCKKEKIQGDVSLISKDIVFNIKEKINKTKDFFWGNIEVCPKNKILVRPAGQKIITTECGCHIWQRVQIDCFNKENNSKYLIKKLLEQSGLKKLYDEDGQGGIFQSITEKNISYKDSSYCYINPFFENGYWENHILESKFIDF